MNLINWSPFRDMEGFFDRYYNLLGRAPFDAEGTSEYQWRPSVDISENKSEYVIKAELPDVNREDVEVSVDNGLLTISGERRYEKDEESETRHRVERMYGRFTRSFTLPADADAEKISAKSKNGILKVRIPKVEEAASKPKRISVD